MKIRGKYLILFCFFISMQILRAQSLWEFKVSPYLIIGVRGDTTITNLYEILNNDSLKYSTQFSCAAKLLAIYEKENVRDFIMNKIEFWGNKTSQPFSINKFFDYQLFRGYFGDESVIATLDSIVINSNLKDIQLSAISYLCEANNFNHFEIVKSLFNNKSYSLRSIGILQKYGRVNSFKQEVIDILYSIVRDSTDFSLIHSASISLASLDSILNVEVLNNRFYNSFSNDRYFFFTELDLFDYKNQMNRSKWVIPLEENDEIRQKYIPFIFENDKSLASRGYNSPIWINFIKGRLDVESSLLARFNIKTTLESFIPSEPDSTTGLIDMLNNLEDYVDSVYNYTWLGDLTFSNELKNILTIAKTDLQNGDSLSCRVQVKSFQDLVDNVYKDSLNSDPRFVTIEGWKFLYWNAQYILDRLPEPQANPNLLVNLKNSLGNQIPASNVKYYESATSGWKDAVNNGDGTFTVITTKPIVSIRMFYEYANQTVHNVTAQNNTYTFTTVNTAVELRNSSGNLIPAPSGDQGTVQYYAGAWRNFGTTTNGVAYKELLPINYSFRMTYEYVPNDKQQDISTNSTVTFSTVLCTVKVTNANNQTLAGANTKYYSTAWRDIGLTNSEGIITKELLPKNLSFRATYGNISLDKQQDIGVNNLVEIQLNTQ